MAEVHEEKTEVPVYESSLVVIETNDEKASRETSETPSASANQLQRRMKTRHLTMIAIGGTIGTGLFLTVGASVAEAGPAGCFISYVIVGLMVYSIVMSLGEMSAYLPLPGAFNSFGSRFVDPALGFTLGVNYFFQWALSVPSELTAAQIIIGYWNSTIPTWVWAIVIMVLMVGINLVQVRAYAELEYWLSIIKVLTVLVFIIVGILVNVGAVGNQGYIGTQYWYIDGAAPTFTGIFSVAIYAFYSFGGTELVAITAGESENPAVAVPRAIRVTFWRIFLFFILTVLIISLDIPYNDPNLFTAMDDSDVSASPFTLVFQNAGIGSAASIMNGIILTSVLSATNSCFYASSRTLTAMAKEGKAPKIFMRVTKHGVPVWSMVFTTVIASLSFLGTIWGNGVVFSWLIALTGSSSILTWASISVIHIRFRMALKKQGRSLSDLPYRALFFPVGPIIALIISALVFASYGYAADWSNAAAVVNTYISVVIFAILLVGFKIIKKTKLIPLDEVDLDTDRWEYTPADAEAEKSRKWYKHVLDWFM
ncbi:amino acid permease/ SLC12A domain-containing protein [Gongronella butleri]|nr:amino acid permease/ SLC12A domain-containing protein [Gongronella butleri]